MIPEQFNISEYRSILCLNGTLPEADFFKQFTLPVIAADGAANRLEKLGITPDLIVGDLDSVHPHLRESCPTLFCAEQSTSDYQKALAYLQETELLPAIIVGIQDGYLDHVLNNINLFMSGNNLLYAPPIMGKVLSKDTELNLAINTKISLFGLPNAVISSQGLKWELNHSALSFPGQNSCFNRTSESKIHLQMHQGNALFLIYLIAMEDAGSQLI